MPTLVGIALLTNVLVIVVRSLPEPGMSYSDPVLLVPRLPRVRIVQCGAAAVAEHIIPVRALVRLGRLGPTAPPLRPVRIRPPGGTLTRWAVRLTFCPVEHRSMRHDLPRRLLPLATSAIILALSAGRAEAQDRPSYLQVSAGIGYAAAGSRGDGIGTGVAGGIECVDPWNLWISARIYAAGVHVRADESSCEPSVSPCAISNRVALLGLRLRWLIIAGRRVGPFIEGGIGTSLGEMETRLGADGSHAAIDEHRTAAFHGPVSFGLAIGKSGRHDIAFDYYFHGGSEHVAGSLSVNIGVW